MSLTPILVLFGVICLGVMFAPPKEAPRSSTEAALTDWSKRCKPESLRWGAMQNDETHERAFVVVCPPGGDK